MANDVYVIGDIGTQFQTRILQRDPDTNALTPVDLTTFTTTLFEFQKEDGTIIQKTANVLGDPTNGQLEYLSEPTLAVVGEHGTWHFRPTIEKTGVILTARDWIEFLVVE